MSCSSEARGSDSLPTAVRFRSHASSLHAKTRKVQAGTSPAPRGSMSLEMMIVASVDKTGGANKSSSTRISAVGGPVFRYFIIDNLALSLNVGGFFKSSDDVTKTSDVGGVGTVGANYYARLGGGMFLFPGLGVGGFFGGRNAGVDPNVARSSIAGFAARAGLGLAFYASSRFNLFARPEALILIGSSKLKGVQNAESAPFTSVDVGFNVGLSYVF
jgi:hypothetical protein